MDRLALYTTFLIDLQNERRARGSNRWATAFLKDHVRAELLLPSVALGEYLEGFDDPDGEAAHGLVAALETLPATAETAQLYAKMARSLRSRGRLIGTNDLWIGCTALAAGVGLVTRNVEHFRRIPGLPVLTYARE